MEYFLVEEKSFKTMVNEDLTIVGIKMKKIEQPAYSLEEFPNYKFYVTFITSTGKELPNLNNPYPTVETFVSSLVEKGVTLDLAKASIYNILKNLEFGTRQEKYTAASVLAANYGFVLKPIEQQ